MNSKDTLKIEIENIHPCVDDGNQYGFKVKDLDGMGL